MQRKQVIEESRRVLHLSKDEPTGHALRRLLQYHLEQAQVTLDSADDMATVKSAQAEKRLCKKLMEYQDKPPLQIPNR